MSSPLQIQFAIMMAYALNETRRLRKEAEQALSDVRALGGEELLLP